MPRIRVTKRKWHKNQHSALKSSVQSVNIVESDVNSVVNSDGCAVNSESVVNIDQTPVAVNPNPTSSDEPKPSSASRKKLTYISDTVVCDQEDVGKCSGNLIIDVNLLSDLVRKSVMCSKCNGTSCITLVENVAKRKGLASVIELLCSKCDFKNSSSTSRLTTQRLQEVNVRYTYGLRSIGKGKKAGEMLAAVMNLPKPTTNYSHYSKTIAKHVQRVSKESMQAAAKEAVSENIGSTKTDIPVALDGSWHKRGHTSLNGVVTATSVDTGKVLDLECLTKYCSCPKSKGEKVHINNCASNYDGSSGGMETEGAVRIFNRSVQTHGLRYTDYLGDGDSKGFRKVVESKPYGDNVAIQKLECVGHVQKRMGSRLLRIVKDKKNEKLSDGKKGLSGRGRLTKKEIDLLQVYYGNAIRRNSNNLAGMKRDIWATYFHKLSTDKQPQHQLCPPGDSKDCWCKYNKAQVSGKQYSHTHSLPESILIEIKKIYKDLTNEDLLKKCLHGRTQNCNESFNNVIWVRIPKTVFVGIDTLKFGAYDAALCFNDGNIGKIKVLQDMGVDPGHNMKSGLISIDIARVSEADKATEAATKSARQQRRNSKRKSEDAEEDADDPDYGAGLH